GVERHANTDSQGNSLPTEDKIKRRNAQTEPFSQRHCFMPIDSWRNHDELFATVPPDDIAVTRYSPQRISHHDEDTISLPVTPGVVQLLEMIDVNEIDRERVTAPLRTVDLAFHRIVDSSVIVQTRQPIPDRRFSDFPVQIL